MTIEESESTGSECAVFGHRSAIDAACRYNGIAKLLVSTDPPYYDNIGYAALSDFVYVWLRRTIGASTLTLFSTVLVPKIPELTASPERFEGDKGKPKNTSSRVFAMPSRLARQNRPSLSVDCLLCIQAG